jgi:hypothetical protein
MVDDGLEACACIALSGVLSLVTIISIYREGATSNGSGGDQRRTSR